VASEEAKIARAEEDRSDTWLNKVKAIKELEGIDIDHITRLIEVAQKIGERVSPNVTKR
jgi:hypothetical protein